MKKYLIILLAVSFTFLGSICCRAQEERLLLFSFVDGGGKTNEWFFPLSMRTKIPKWDPESGELPLSLTKAMKTSRKWVENREHGTNFQLASVCMCPVRPHEGFNQIFYYKFFYDMGNGQNHFVTVVLMNGSVLEPEILK